MSKAHADWPALVAESQTHGVAATARRHGVNTKTLRRWKWRLAHTQQAAPIELVPITLVTAPHDVATITCGAAERIRPPRDPARGGLGEVSEAPERCMIAEAGVGNTSEILQERGRSARLDIPRMAARTYREAGLGTSQ